MGEPGGLVPSISFLILYNLSKFTTEDFAIKMA